MKTNFISKLYNSKNTQLFNLKLFISHKFFLKFSHLNLFWVFSNDLERRNNWNQRFRSKYIYINCNWELFIWNNIRSQSLVCSHQNLKFIILEVYGEMIKSKIVDIVGIYKFIVKNLFIWYYLSKENYICISHIWNLKFLNDLERRNDQNQSCSIRGYQQLCS
jgi:hypothetical protein